MKTIILISALVLAVYSFEQPPTGKVLIGYTLDNRDGCIGYQHNYNDNTSYVKYMCCNIDKSFKGFGPKESFKGFTTDKNDLTVFAKFDAAGLSDGKTNCTVNSERINY